ncbi:MAG: polymer-forming cytoskeletal protein [Lacibacter sp.]
MFKKGINNEVAGGLATIIAAGTEIRGNIESKGDIRVDGTLIGNLKAGSKVIVGPQGTIQGDVEAEQADIQGTIVGSVQVSGLLVLQAGSNVQGNVRTGQLQIDASAIFNGECHMNAPGASVVELQKETKHAGAVKS